MNFLKKVLLASFFLTNFLSLFLPSTALAASQCYCQPTDSVMRQIAELQGAGKTPAVQYSAQCLDLKPNQNCDAASVGVDAAAYVCQLKDSAAACDTTVKQWTDSLKASANNNANVYKVLGIAIPACLFDPVLTSQCRDVTLLIRLLINFATWIFGIIGALALLMFVYGGFVMILSQGNAEKVQQGMGILTAAVIGLAITFGAYLLIKFVGTSLGIQSVYQLQ